MSHPSNQKQPASQFPHIFRLLHVLIQQHRSHFPSAFFCDYWFIISVESSFLFCFFPFNGPRRRSTLLSRLSHVWPELNRSNFASPNYICVWILLQIMNPSSNRFEASLRLPLWIVAFPRVTGADIFHRKFHSKLVPFPWSPYHCAWH